MRLIEAEKPAFGRLDTVGQADQGTSCADRANGVPEGSMVSLLRTCLHAVKPKLRLSELLAVFFRWDRGKRRRSGRSDHPLVSFSNRRSSDPLRELINRGNSSKRKHQADHGPDAHFVSRLRKRA